MSENYEEILEGETVNRVGPRPRHEEVCARLHERVGASLARVSTSQLLPPRTGVQLTHANHFRPDLALITSATGKLWLAAEIISSEDHRTDTVIKKQIYEELNLPRLWMIDCRYDNVEIYHGSPYGMTLKGMLAGREVLTEQLLPEFQFVVAELFGVQLK